MVGQTAMAFESAGVTAYASNRFFFEKDTVAVRFF